MKIYIKVVMKAAVTVVFGALIFALIHRVGYLEGWRSGLKSGRKSAWTDCNRMLSDIEKLNEAKAMSKALEKTAREWLASQKQNYREAVNNEDWIWAERHRVQIILLTRLLNSALKKGDKIMTLNEFAKRVTKAEGLKKSTNVAQVKEVLRVANVESNGEIYKAIRNIQE